VRLGEVSKNTLSNIIYSIRVFQELNNCLKKSQETLSGSM
jgi:hypothetical protein